MPDNELLDKVKKDIPQTGFVTEMLVTAMLKAGGWIAADNNSLIRFYDSFRDFEPSLGSMSVRLTGKGKSPATGIFPRLTLRPVLTA
jgi:hypothetical protein